MTVIFACVHNAGRSQMAAAFYNHFAGTGAISAGTQPAKQVHPEVITVMHEAGIDLSKTKPQLLTAELAKHADILITMGCGESCPYVPGLQKLDWLIEDPKDKPIETVRHIRDEIKNKVKDLIDRQQSISYS